MASTRNTCAVKIEVICDDVQWLDKRDVSCEHTVDFQSKDKNAGCPLVARVDVRKMDQTMCATIFAGKEFTAKQAYYYYRALRIVALKRNKGSTSAGFGGASVGMAASGLQAAQLRAHLNRDQLVREYAAASGVKCLDTQEFFSTRPPGPSMRQFC